MTPSRSQHSIVIRIASWLALLVILASAKPARGQDIYYAVLTPPDSDMVDIDSLRFGVATFAVGEEAIIYSIWLHNIDRVTAVRLRATAEAGTGEGTVQLYALKETGRIDGRLTSGWFRAKALQGMAWDEFLLAIETSCVTVELDSRNPRWGSLTGQLLPLEAPADSVLAPQLAWSRGDGRQ
jgi:hypothetical protein